MDFDPAYGDGAALSGAQMLARGDWRPAALLLHETGNDWDRKAHRVARLAHDLKAHGAISAWVAAEPLQPRCACSRRSGRGEQGLGRAGNSYANQVSQGKWKRFFAHLNAADDAARRAIACAPHDPTPWAIAVMLARGLQLPRDSFDQRWNGLLQRDPQHIRGHYDALQYLTAKWSGSHQEMFSFALRTSDSAALGSPLHMLPLYAVTEYALALNTRRVKGGPRFATYRKGEQVKEAMARAVDLWDKPTETNGTPPHASAVFDRSHLFWWAKVTRDRTLAARQHKAMGPHSAELPWSYVVPYPRLAIRLSRMFTRS